MLVYGGMLALALSLFIPPEQATLGLVLMGGGGLAVAVGALLIVLRSRMKP